eukprot:scaffold1179_cov118-Isochrysis_galbana.AAC.14
MGGMPQHQMAQAPYPQQHAGGGRGGGGWMGMQGMQAPQYGQYYGQQAQGGVPDGASAATDDAGSRSSGVALWPVQPVRKVRHLGSALRDRALAIAPDVGPVWRGPPLLGAAALCPSLISSGQYRASALVARDDFGGGECAPRLVFGISASPRFARVGHPPHTSNGAWELTI